MKPTHLIWTAFTLACLAVAPSLVQAKPDKGDKNDPNSVRLSPEDRMREHLRQVLAVNDAEWQVLGPKIDRIQALMREATSKSGGVKIKDKSDRPEGSKDKSDRPEGSKDKSGRDPSEKKDKSAKSEAKAAAREERGEQPVSLVGAGYAQLRAVGSDREAQVSDMKEALDEYRMAKAIAKDELAKARSELRELVTVRQEVQLVLLGILD